MTLLSRQAFFEHRPAFESPLPYRFFITLACASGRALNGKTHCLEQQPDICLSIRDQNLASAQLFLFTNSCAELTTLEFLRDDQLPRYRSEFSQRIGLSAALPPK
ncbi:hypothetical protein ASE07_12460 [Noviherbaspirillum sp. Root189]|nr:hypothetical protein ASE07_12460 [Noviherbaspirillum sp. Root189]